MDEAPNPTYAFGVDNPHDAQARRRPAAAALPPAGRAVLWGSGDCDARRVGDCVRAPGTKHSQRFAQCREP